jgi:hypothetical protein
VQVTDPCAYAWFDLGHALRLAGRPEEAVPILEHRLQNANQAQIVQHELDQARADMAPAHGDGKPGHGRRKFKQHGKKG